MYRKYRIVESITSSVSQYESYRDQVYCYTPRQDLGRVRLREMLLVKWALNELINCFDLLSQLTLSRVQSFSDRGQTW